MPLNLPTGATSTTGAISAEEKEEGANHKEPTTKQVKPQPRGLCSVTKIPRLYDYHVICEVSDSQLAVISSKITCVRHRKRWIHLH